MYIALLAALATAGAPGGVDLNDLDHWELAAEAFLDGPPGCWEIVGQASWDWDAGRFGMSRGDAVFASQLVDGVWGEFHIEPLGEVNRDRGERTESLVYIYDTRWAPLFGKIDGELKVSNGPRGEMELPVDAVDLDPKQAAREERQQVRREARREKNRDDGDKVDTGPNNALRRALDEISGTSSVTSWTQWDEAGQAVVLSRAVPIKGSGNKEAEQTIRFPGGAAPNAMDVVFPETWYTGSLPRVRVSDAQAHLRVRPSGGMLFPTAESFRMELGILGFKVTGAQTIRYKSIRPCHIAEQGPEAPAETVPEVAPAFEEEVLDVEPTE